MGSDPSAIRREVETARERLGRTVEALRYKTDLKSRARDAVARRIDTVRQTIGDVMDSVKNTTDGATKRAGSALGGAKRKATTRMGEMRGAEDGTAPAPRRKPKLPAMPAAPEMPSIDVRGAAQRLGIGPDRPLMLMLGAATIGFLAGLLIPATDVERRTMGPLSEELLDRAQTVKEDVLVAGRAVVNETTQAAIAGAQRSLQSHGQQVLAGGLDPDTLATNVIDHGRQVLRETVDAATEAARTTAQTQGERIAADLRGEEADG